MEIERKYLLDNLPFNELELDGFEKIEIEQSYISTDPTIRIRRMNDSRVLTVKGPGLLSREEFELLLTEEQFEKLLLKAEMPPLFKTRYKIPLDGGLTAELDVYHNNFAPLMTVEVEFASVEQSEAFLPPEWFGRDVTFDPRYKNGHLARYGI